MPAIGIRQLKNDASEIIRTVREEKVEYIITLRGQPVAILRPIEPVVEDSDAILRLAGEVFADLDDDALAEVEAAIQRRPDFFADAELVAP
ncbi:MAG: type II toxin-antitoxin system prevent-host-death family antitoxin [Caldilinea sp.]|uniref:type II toxin-antitoxin system Phd/YefM family antitoxin n=1 Tax=Caldilinea sp. TaxID=2293560 RepID=UPI002CFD42BA|nr:type II toxin-antitoxin system prevent-host-death family antitoxin [Caldilinea sp.]